jgi:hypothetical protein
MSAVLDVTHPYPVLEHIVRVVLPSRCQSNTSGVVAKYYEEQLDNPGSTIAQCKSFLADWVLELAGTGSLRDVDEYAISASIHP